MNKKTLAKHLKSRKLTTLVENRTSYAADCAELNIYETHKVAKKVKLQFEFPIIASMLMGKKIMHLDGMPEFEFFPGESVVMPANEKMVIDFPIAEKGSPTKCLALGIDPDKISDIIDKFNQHTSIESENNNWKIGDVSNHLKNNEGVNYLINRLVHTFINNNKSKDVLLDLMIQELVIRLLQTNAKKCLLSDKLDILNDSRIGVVLKFIKENLTDKNMDVDTLAKKACMSNSHFYKKFKNTLGTSPIDYINSEKIKFAKKLMKERQNLLISEVAFLSGFNNSSYFIRQFKKIELITPQQFKKSLLASNNVQLLKLNKTA